MKKEIFDLINSENDEDMILGLRIFVETHTIEEIKEMFPVPDNYPYGQYNCRYFKRRQQVGFDRIYILKYKDFHIRVGAKSITFFYNYQREDIGKYKILDYGDIRTTEK